MGERSGEEFFLIIEGRSIRCKKNLLRDNSDYFKTLFESDFKEKGRKSVVLQEVDVGAVEVALKWVEDESCRPKDGDLLRVLPVADYLMLGGIREKCSRRLKWIVTPENCLQVWATAERYGIEDAAKRARNFALKYFPELKESDWLPELGLEVLVDYLTDKHLKCEDEMDVFLACINWLRSKDAKTVKTMTVFMLFSCIRYRRLSPKQFEEMKNHPALNDHPIVKECVGRLISERQKISTGFYSKVIDGLAVVLLTSKRKRKLWPVLHFGIIFRDGPHGKQKEISFRCDLGTDEVEENEVDLGIINELLTRESAEINAEEKCASMLTQIDSPTCKVAATDDFIFLLREEARLDVFDRSEQKWTKRDTLLSKKACEMFFVGNECYVVLKSGNYGYHLFRYDCKTGTFVEVVKMPATVGETLIRKPFLCAGENQLFLLTLSRGGLSGFVLQLGKERPRWTEIDLDPKLENFVYKSLTGLNLIMCKERVYFFDNRSYVAAKINEADNDGIKKKVLTVDVSGSFQFPCWQHPGCFLHEDAIYILHVCTKGRQKSFKLSLQKWFLSTNSIDQVFEKTLPSHVAKWPLLYLYV